MDLDPNVRLQLPEEWQRYPKVIAELEKLVVMYDGMMDTLSVWGGQWVASTEVRWKAVGTVVAYFKKAFKVKKGDPVLDLKTLGSAIRYQIELANFDEEPVSNQWNRLKDQLHNIANMLPKDPDYSEDRLAEALSAAEWTPSELDSTEGTVNFPSVTAFKGRSGSYQLPYQWRSKETTHCLLKVQPLLEFMWSSAAAQQKEHSRALALVEQWMQMLQPQGRLWNMFEFQQGRTESIHSNEDIQNLSALCESLLEADDDIKKVWLEVLEGEHTLYSEKDRTALAQCLIIGLQLLNAIVQCIALPPASYCVSLSTIGTANESASVATSRASATTRMDDCHSLMQEMNRSTLAVSEDKMMRLLESLAPESK
jgi:hypothetical protein